MRNPTTPGLAVWLNHAEYLGSLSGSTLFPNLRCIWEFPKISGTVFWGPYKKDPSIWGSLLGSPTFGNPHIAPLRVSLA